MPNWNLKLSSVPQHDAACHESMMALTGVGAILPPWNSLLVTCN
jgi:hypothetical protein